MPVIPQYQQQFDRQSVDLNATKQALNTPLAAFGSDGKELQSGGQGLTNMGTALGAVAYRMRVEEDENKAYGAYIQLHDAMNPFLNGEGGVYSQSGENALGAVKRTQEAFQKVQDEIAGSLDNDNQRTAFLKKAQAFRVESETSVARHEAQQRKEWQAGTQLALAESEGSYAVTNYTSSSLFEAGMARGAEAVRGAAKLKGLSPEATDRMVAEYQSKIILQAAERGADAGALGFAQGLGKDARLLGEDAMKLESKLKPLTELAQAQSVVEKTRALGIDAQLAAIEKSGLNPLAKERAKDMAKSDYSFAQVRRNEAERVQAQQWEDGLTKALKAGDTSLVNKYVAEAPRGMQREAQAYVTTMSKGAGVVSDPAVDWYFTNLAATDPEKFKAEWKSIDHLTDLSPEDRHKFDGIYLGIGKADGKVVWDEVRSDADRIKEAAASVLGMRVADLHKVEPDSAQGQLVARLNRRYAEEVSKAIRANGGKAIDPVIKDQLMDRLILKGKVKGTGWNDWFQDTAYQFEQRPGTVLEEPTRPNGMPAEAVWDSDAVGWRVGNKLFRYQGH
ncbi:hypothetical protein [Desulfovibrio aminophilus]|uniref:hypothetical protein n=1 Tax=Desulfovibrio aminophilus TaxID=81425 RepID=UPI00041BEC54|nr:hypothetical protein [Desulfovibrio aminophilus]